MEIELRVAVLETERRWNWRQFFDANVAGTGTVLGRFLSYRDDDTFVWLHAFDAEEQRERLTAILAGAPPRRAESVRRLTPSAAGSTVRGHADLAVLAGWPVIEIRQYRLAPGTRSRFTRFLFDKTLEPQKRCGMSLAGPFDDLDDENVQTWFRGFPSLAERDGAKAAFYQSRLWLDDLEAEAFTMIEDYSNVMLVTPV